MTLRSPPDPRRRSTPRAPTKLFGDEGRYVDVLDQNGTAHESEVGFVRYSRSIIDQSEKGAYLVGSGRITGARRHVASDVSETITTDPRTIDLLVAQRIASTVHVP